LTQEWPWFALPSFVGNHADELLAPHLGLEAAADPAITARRYQGVFRLADVDHRLLDERRGRAGLDTGATGYALRFEEWLHLPRRSPARKTAPIDREGEGSLDFLASTNATVADDAFRRIVAKIRVRFVFFVGEVVGPA
jgi:hypothetical protein